MKQRFRRSYLSVLSSAGYKRSILRFQVKVRIRMRRAEDFEAWPTSLPRFTVKSLLVQSVRFYGRAYEVEQG
ncbi:MAG: hypothetical protein CM1200mP39_13410 [Dehalococcoidia bacterium]|nr:MAG: hypothetical protein CM1200mP39_13410 [Dehalococcoidia bacterium]